MSQCLCIKNDRKQCTRNGSEKPGKNSLYIAFNTKIAKTPFPRKKSQHNQQKKTFANTDQTKK